MSEIQLLKRDIDMIIKFQAWCNLRGLKQFSADDFRDYLGELRKELPDAIHDTGGIFRTMIVTNQAGFAKNENGEPIWVKSRHPENHGRAIRLYEWKQKP